MSATTDVVHAQHLGGFAHRFRHRGQRHALEGGLGIHGGVVSSTNYIELVVDYIDKLQAIELYETERHLVSDEPCPLQGYARRSCVQTEYDQVCAMQQVTLLFEVKRRSAEDPKEA